MACLEFRNAISARLDGEEQPGEAAAVDAHLATCADCAEYADRAARVTRLTRTRTAEAGPDLVAAVLAAAPAPRRRLLRALPVRLGLVAVGLGQFVLAVSGVVAAGHHHDVDVAQVAGAGIAHLAHESAAWNLALAIGFVWAATGATRPSGLVPILSGFVGVLAVLSVLDASRGGVDPARLATHGFVVVGLVLLLLLQRATRGGGGSGRRGVAGLASWAADTGTGRGSGSSGTGGLAPAGRDLAA